MYFATITNPATNRQNRVRVMTIETATLFDILKTTGSNVKAISAHLLDQAFSTDEAIEANCSGEDARSNFALSIFENALDWTLGMIAVNYVKAYKAAHPGKKPRMIRVAVNRSGDAFIVSKDGSVIYH